MPKLKELAAKHGDQGLVLIGVHSARGGEKMAAYVEQTGIQYPVAIDTGATVKSYFVDGYPDYHIIDRAGNLRVADLSNGDVERVVGLLLAEPAPSTIHPALADASAKAKKKDKRMLVHWGTVEEHAEMRKLLKGDRALSKLLSNEFEVVRLARGESHDLVENLAVEKDTQFVAALHADGTFAGSMTANRIDAESLRGFLERYRVPIKNAETLWADAKARAEREKKRVLVHLGAPWWGWCFKLEEFLGRPAVAPIIDRHFVDLKIDTERHANGAEVAKALRGDRTGGIPWMVITDAAGSELVTSDGPGGNVGCPVTEDERAWFVEMLRRSAPGVTEKEIATITSELAAYAKSLGR